MSKAPAHVARRFVSRVNHELRTPLTTIIGYAELLASGSPPQAGHADIILHSARQLLALLDDVSDYAKGCVQPEAPHPEAAYTAALLDGVAAQARDWARAGGNTFELLVQGEPPLALHADVPRLRRLLLQLLSNAAKFTHGGRIRLDVHVGPPDADGSGTAWWRFTVSDTGIGIEPEVLARLFEPWQRPQGSHHAPGLGLGLGLAQQQAHSMGGRLQAHSVPGQGTALTLVVPLRAAAEDEVVWPLQLPGDALVPDLDGAGHCVWVVEDCAPVCELLCAELQSHGFSALPFADGLDAIAHMAHAGARAPQLIVTDLHMPGADGTAVREQAHRHWPGLPVILLTAALDTAAVATQNYCAVLAKPLERARLCSALATALGLEPPAMPNGDAAYARVVPTHARPAARYIAQFTEMVRLGAVSDIAECADALARTHDAWQPFLAQLKHLADRGDLQGCQRLLAP